MLMNKHLKASLVFCTFYLILDLVGVLFVFSWTSFGGRNSMSWWQEIIEVLLTFPAANLVAEEKGLFVYFLLNAVFWTLVFMLLRFLVLQMKNFGRPKPTSI